MNFKFSGREFVAPERARAISRAYCVKSAAGKMIRGAASIEGDTKSSLKIEIQL
jgi:hypothetical protein